MGPDEETQQDSSSDHNSSQIEVYENRVEEAITAVPDSSDEESG